MKAMKLKLLLASATLAAGTTVLSAADEKAFEKALMGHIMVRVSVFNLCRTVGKFDNGK